MQNRDIRNMKREKLRIAQDLETEISLSKNKKWLYNLPDDSQDSNKEMANKYLYARVWKN